jgi:diguanylate cyclase (GGDEF)-like protein
MLGARAHSRVLLIMRNAGDAATGNAANHDVPSRLRSILEAAEHTVSASSLAQWQHAAEAVAPDIILLEAAPEVLDQSMQVCSAIKRTMPMALVLAVIPAGDAESADALWPDLREAGADDFIHADIGRVELEARVLLMSRLAVLERDLEGARERLARHLQIDEVTQLLNRRFFFQAAHRECSRARRYDKVLACLMIDIDYLEEVGKTFGYGCVEYVLRAVAYIVRQWTRDSDICGRFSERKFAILLPETNIEGATSVREKILSAVAETQFEWEGKDLPITVTIGEAERKRGLALGTSAAGADESTPETNAEAGEVSADESSPDRVSVREELAALLEDADAALSVARRASIRPEIFVQYTLGGDTPPAAK